MRIQNLPPMEIERESFRIITAELGDRPLDPEQAPIVKRVIHTTADFHHADNLYFSPDAVALAKAAIRGGATVVTDTQMALAGIGGLILGIAATTLVLTKKRRKDEPEAA